ncbi:PREDICTED: uncharacterized protein LOC109327637 [Lupinus angustifolius]|uniref:uncharacterized protein LOC109327637 n=1 Tax=Lupinus angustifolius TaxID=3871 RepID=UPI00092F5144|nr:PREDICTED: uncharacterized protein LOC109327637 [Lupinus angustifolius]
MIVSQDHSKLNSSFIADLIVNLVSADPSIPVKALVKEVVSRFGYTVTVTYRKAWTAKQMAMAKIYGDWEGSYNELPHPSIPVKTLVKEVVSRFGYTVKVTYRKAWTAKQMAMAKIYGDWEGSYNELPQSRPDRYVAKCKHFGAGCEWRIRASYNVKRDYWEIRKISGTHSCVSMVVSQDHSKLNSSFIADLIVNLVSADPSIPVKALVKEVVSRFGYTVTVTYRKAWTAKHIISDRGTGLLAALRSELTGWSSAQSVYCIHHVASNFNKEFRNSDLKDKVVEMGYELMRPRF